MANIFWLTESLTDKKPQYDCKYYNINLSNIFLIFKHKLVILSTYKRTVLFSYTLSAVSLNNSFFSQIPLFFCPTGKYTYY